QPKSGVSVMTIRKALVNRAPLFCGGRDASEPARNPWNSRLAVERGAIPAAGIGSCFVGGLQEPHQRLLWFKAAPHRLVRQQKLTESLVKTRFRRLNLAGAEALRRGIRIGIKHRLIHAGTAWPEAGRRNLVAVGFLRDAVRQSRNASRMQRRRSAGKARDGKVERAPEQMHGRDLAEETGTELLEHARDQHQR